MSKHTPGKWEIKEDRLGVCVGLNNFLHPTEARVLTEEECEREDVEPCDDYIIADCSGGYFPRPLEECEANTRLIAAAPKLLEACKYALSEEQPRRVKDILRQAITKAESAAEGKK